MIFKKRKLFFIMSIFLFCRTGLGLEKVIAAADKWCPYTCAAGEDYDGFSIELLREALKLSKIELSYLNAPFTRVTFEVERGEWQIHAATDKDFTPNLLIGKEAVSKSKWVFVSTKKSGWTYRGIESLKGKRFAKINGYVYSDGLTEFYNKPENKNLIVPVASDSPQSQIFKMMKLGRVDVMVEDESIIHYWAKKLDMEDKIVLSGVDSKQDFYPGYTNSKENAQAKDLMALVDKNLKVVKNNKKFMNDLFKKYGIEKWQ